MRALFVSHNVDFVGGGELSLLQLTRGVRDRGHEVMLAVPGCGWLQEQAEAAGINTIIAAMPGLASPACLPELVRWRRFAATVWHPDIIHANTPRSAIYGGMAGWGGGVPVVFHARISWPDIRLDWLIARLTRCVIANSHSTARRFATHRRLDVRVVHNGIDTEGFEKIRASAKPFGARQILLCVARVSRWKRHDVLLEAFDLLAAKHETLHLVCAGGVDEYDPEWMGELRLRTDRLCAAHRVHWVGHCTDPREWYAAADVFVLASESEPFGRVVVEAMASGVPVVAINRGGPAEIVENGVQGLLCSPADAHDMAHKIDTLLQDAVLRRRLGEAGRQRAREFGLPRHLDAMVSLFESVVHDVE